MVTVVFGLLGLVSWSSLGASIAPLIAFHSIVGLIYRHRVNRTLECLRSLHGETQVVRAGLRLLEQQRFKSAKLCGLKQQARNSAAAIRQLDVLIRAMEIRTKDAWFYAPSLTLAAGTQLCMAAERWRQKHSARLKIWFRAWAEFEALNCLACYSYENPGNSFPVFSDEPCLQAEDLGHPLLPDNSCVRNDVELNATTPFYVISGSNMSGKSTLLRSIGLNAVLAYAGAPVRARTLRLSRSSIVASLGVMDSLMSGKSKFLAELDRLRCAIGSAVPRRPVLFLIDEILGGTNSRDRRVAAEAIVRTLIKQRAIGAFSTHDLALTEIATADGLRGVNVHMGSRSARDPMDFDYRLKPGITSERSALALARLAGVPI